MVERPQWLHSQVLQVLSRCRDVLRIQKFRGVATAELVARGGGQAGGLVAHRQQLGGSRRVHGVVVELRELDVLDAIDVLRVDVQVEGSVVVEAVEVARVVVVCEARCSVFGHAESLSGSCEVFADLEVAELVLLDAAEVVDEVWLLEVFEALLGVGVTEAVAKGGLLGGALVLF